MTNKVLYYFSFVLLLSAVPFMECGGGNGGKSSAAITMTAEIRGEAHLRFFLAGTGTAFIDWGNGSDPETVTHHSAFDKNLPNAGLTPYNHIFSGTTSPCTIAIGGKKHHISELSLLRINSP